MQTVLITGGTGLIGTALTRLLTSNNYRVIILSRKSHPSSENVIYSVWDPKNNFIEPTVINEADHIVHLAGAGIADKRWTKKRKVELAESRIKGGATIVDCLNKFPNKVQTVVSASGIGWYGEDGKNKNRAFVETDPPGNDFLGKTCLSWEESIRPVTQLGKRLVILRTGIVFAPKGGAFPEFAKPMKAGVAAILGSGNQMISWIHLADICRAYLAAIENKQMNDVYNACAPEHVTNKTLTLSIAKARKRPYIPVHVPEFVLKLVLGEMSIEVLKSATVDDSKLRKTGFQFLFPTLNSAVEEIVGRNT